MTPEQLATRVEKLREQIAERPDFGEVCNALVWTEIGERIAELPADQRSQAEDHYRALWLLLSDDDDTENEGTGDDA